MIRMAVLPGDLAVELKKMSDAGEDSDVMWQMIEDHLDTMQGGAAALAQTFEGVKSTLKGKFTDLLANAFGPITDALVPLIEMMSAKITELKPAAMEAGKAVGEAIKLITEAFGSGKIGELFSLSLKVGAGHALRWISERFSAVFQELAGIFTGMGDGGGFITQLIDAFGLVGQMMDLIAVDFIASLIDKASDFIGYLAAGMSAAPRIFGGALLGFVSTFGGLLFDVMVASVKPLQTILEGFGVDTGGFDKIADKVKAGFEKGGEIAKKNIDEGLDIRGTAAKVSGEVDKAMGFVREGAAAMMNDTVDEFLAGLGGPIMDKIIDLNDVEGNEQKLANLLDGLRANIAEAGDKHKKAADGQGEAAKKQKEVADKKNVDDLTKLGGGGFAGALTFGEGESDFKGLDHLQAIQANKGNADATFTLAARQPEVTAQRDSEKVGLLTQIRDELIQQRKTGVEGKTADGNLGGGLDIQVA